MLMWWMTATMAMAGQAGAQFAWPEGTGMQLTRVAWPDRQETWDWAGPIAVEHQGHAVRVAVLRPYEPGGELLPLAWTVDRNGHFGFVDPAPMAEWPEELRAVASYDAVQASMRAAWEDLVGTWVGMSLQAGPDEHATFRRLGRQSFYPQRTRWRMSGSQPCHESRAELQCVVLTKTEGSGDDVRRSVRVVAEPGTLRPWEMTVIQPGTTVTTRFVWDEPR